MGYASVVNRYYREFIIIIICIVVIIFLLVDTRSTCGSVDCVDDLLLARSCAHLPRACALHAGLLLAAQLAIFTDQHSPSSSAVAISYHVSHHSNCRSESPWTSRT